MILLSTAPKSRLCDHALIYHFATHDRDRREVPDYAVDKHTRRGKELGRGGAEFFAEGSLLENEAPIADEYRELARRAVEAGLSPRPAGPIEPVPTPEDPLRTGLPDEPCG